MVKTYMYPWYSKNTILITCQPPILNKRQLLYFTCLETREAKIIDYLAKHDVTTFALKCVGFLARREVYCV
jgi:hypothetical protein